MRVLIVDDEPQIRRALRVGLERAGYSVLASSCAEEALDLASTHPPDLVILDLAMPGTDGFGVLSELRQWSSVPVIVLTVRDDEQDKIRALDLGADDYLTKPFGVGELMARIRAILRRSGSVETEEPIFRTGDLEIDFARRTVTLSGDLVKLTPIEYDLLKCFAHFRNRVLTHRQLLSKVWGAEYADDPHTLRVHVANLRNKIEPDPTRPKYIHTETRVGYRFQSEN
jgi:two-component system, OmpR family, KDP operon response regulator KdpE